ADEASTAPPCWAACAPGFANTKNEPSAPTSRFRGFLRIFHAPARRQSQDDVLRPAITRSDVIDFIEKKQRLLSQFRKDEALNVKKHFDTLPAFRACAFHRLRQRGRHSFERCDNPASR